MSQGMSHVPYPGADCLVFPNETAGVRRLRFHGQQGRDEFQGHGKRHNIGVETSAYSALFLSSAFATWRE
jgi:hypothetical protein